MTSMIINKNNILTYWSIIRESQNKGEIFLYVLKRMFGVKAKFRKDVIMKQNGILINCGRIMENCTVACSQFEKDIEKEIKQLNGSCIDVGAHIGKHTLTMAKTLGNKSRIISIEPNKTNVALLKDNLRLNRLNNVEVHEVVCSDKNGQVTFYRNEFHPASNSMKRSLDSQEVILPSETLDTIAGNIKDLVLIKIDVEGAEDLVLKGASKLLKNNHPKILFEAWDKEHLAKVKAVLDKYSYQIKKINEENYLAH